MIVDHKLDYAEWDEDEQGPKMVPTLIVVHYTVSRTRSGTAAAFKARDYLSCHTTVGVDGQVTQQVRFDRQAKHAGISKWKLRKRCNTFSIGIEVVNPGPVFADGRGGWKDYYGHPWAGGVVHADHKHNGCSWRHWAEFDDRQIDAVIRLCAELMEAYPTITDVVGHDDVAPRRKRDPGPAWPWAAVRSALLLPSLEKTA